MIIKACYYVFIIIKNISFGSLIWRVLIHNADGADGAGGADNANGAVGADDAMMGLWFLLTELHIIGTIFF